ncbi:hypothetical protein [Salipiger sp. PrR007]|uniref:hypothetical protein n=1 Tax=Salipiger sp. PrR007 TaxID=2706884 RepID=UPI0013BDB567|nr:hypothetical protein [Salipiger sp. PrR007]NDW32949.1 hypothetical protein [Salipiger sp. PrR007]
MTKARPSRRAFSSLDLVLFSIYLRPMWTRKRTIIAGRTDGDNDWLVLKDGQTIGRVYATHISNPTLRWMWIVQVGPTGHGYAPSMDAALDEVRRRVG